MSVLDRWLDPGRRSADSESRKAATSATNPENAKAANCNGPGDPKLSACRLALSASLEPGYERPAARVYPAPCLTNKTLARSMRNRCVFQERRAALTERCPRND
jgi:hypothetical protein